ncbi:hypothetical protein HMN09_00774800 [Mycena chlorophos]|uniref:Uncharacterized protein n=1 Tax=Mycena chlorophos TaxID=658473 RepID=A0A8H6STK6_MYCCL|nr:hypothetical protein HMN09_00774800 [Mycena chlorophos]
MPTTSPTVSSIQIPRHATELRALADGLAFYDVPRPEPPTGELNDPHHRTKPPPPVACTEPSNGQASQTVTKIAAFATSAAAGGRPDSPRLVLVVKARLASAARTREREPGGYADSTWLSKVDFHSARMIMMARPLQDPSAHLFPENSTKI